MLIATFARPGQSAELNPPEIISAPTLVTVPSTLPPPTGTAGYGPQAGGPQSAWWLGSFPITQHYGCTTYAPEGYNPNHPNCQFFHEGIDFGAPCGTLIFAGHKCQVMQIDPPGYGPPGHSAAIRLHLLEGGAQVDVWIYHMRDYVVAPGQILERAQNIGHSGTRGYSTGCHIHFEVRPAGGGYRSSIEPTPWMIPDIGAQAGPPEPPPTPPPGTGYRVTARAGLIVHTEPGLAAPRAGVLPFNTQVYVNCQTYGPYVAGSQIWDHITGPIVGYVADAYVSTPSFNRFSPGFRDCRALGPHH